MLLDLLTVYFENVEAVTLNGGSGGNFLWATGTPAATSVVVNTGAGSDTVKVTGTAVKSSTLREWKKAQTGRDYLN